MIETVAVSNRQEAALNNHVPRAKAPNPVLAVIFCLLFSATVFTIIDLDHPQGGLIGVDVAPLRNILGEMINAPGSKPYVLKP